MSKAQYLEDEYIDRSIGRYGVRLFHPSDAIALIAEAEKRRIRILGIDSFRIKDEKIYPILEEILDFSSRGHFSADDWSAAIRFIEERKDSGILFEVVLGDSIEIKK